MHVRFRLHPITAYLPHAGVQFGLYHAFALGALGWWSVALQAEQFLHISGRKVLVYG